jgi:hypothetical protein
MVGGVVVILNHLVYYNRDDREVKRASESTAALYQYQPGTIVSAGDRDREPLSRF